MAEEQDKQVDKEYQSHCGYRNQRDSFYLRRRSQKQTEAVLQLRDRCWMAEGIKGGVQALQMLQWEENLWGLV